MTNKISKKRLKELEEKEQQLNDIEKNANSGEEEGEGLKKEDLTGEAEPEPDISSAVCSECGAEMTFEKDNPPTKCLNCGEKFED